MISIFGLNVAAYWAELLNIYPRVIKKKKEEILQANGFFTIDREYIRQRTSLDISEQTKCDKVLINVGALAVDENDSKSICISLNTMFEILTEDDLAAITDIQKKAKSKKSTAKATKQDMIKFNLKKAIKETDEEVKTAYYNWIDSILDGKNFLTKQVVEIFESTIQAFSTVKAIKLKIIEIAIVHSYKDATWAINIYNKDCKKPGTFIGVEQKQNVGIDPNSSF